MSCDSEIIELIRRLRKRIARLIVLVDALIALNFTEIVISPAEITSLKMSLIFIASFTVILAMLILTDIDEL